MLVLVKYLSELFLPAMSAHTKSQQVTYILSFSRCEIESTLERLRKLERELYSKEKELEEREMRLKLWEERLMERSNMSPSPTSLLMERSNISPVSGC